MKHVASPPFLQACPGDVRAGRWEHESAGAWQELGESLSGWDYLTRTLLRRRIECSAEAIWDHCKLPTGTPLTFSVMWHATGTNRRGQLCQAELEGSNVTLMGELPGEELGGQLRLTTRLVLATGLEAAERLAARRCGSILWQDQVVTWLEGEASMFPVELVDFDVVGFPPHAGWILDWKPEEPERAALGSMRLLINAGHEAVRRSVANPDADDEARAVLSAIRWDLLRQLIEGGLDTDFEEAASYPEGSIGAAIKTALMIAFSSNTSDEVRTRRRILRSDYETHLQAASRVFER